MAHPKSMMISWPSRATHTLSSLCDWLVRVTVRVRARVRVRVGVTVRMRVRGLMRLVGWDRRVCGQRIDAPWVPNG